MSEFEHTAEGDESTNGNGASTKVVLPSIGSVVDGEDEGFSEIKHSLCMHCGGEGTTRMLMTKIPFFREVIISSFECDACSWSNNEVLFGGELQERGRRFELTVRGPEDLDRQIIKSDYASVTFPELEFEIPPKTQQGEITTVEGLLSTAATRLGYEQQHRMATDPTVGLAVAEVISKLSAMAAGAERSLPFTVIVDDPSGNSFVENPKAPARDPGLKAHDYVRSAAQDMMVGLQPSQDSVNSGSLVEHAPTTQNHSNSSSPQTAGPNASGGRSGKRGEGLEKLALQQQQRDTAAAATTAAAAAAAAGSSNGSSSIGSAIAEAIDNTNFMRKEHARFEDLCPSCRQSGETLMCMVDIPHFKEVIIMAFTCPNCGYKSNEVKGGGAVPPKGTIHTLTATCSDDFSRDILKSDTCAVLIVELELELDMGTLGSMYSTLEGLLEKIRTNLADGNPFFSGDSATNTHSMEGGMQKKFRIFLEKLDVLRAGDSFPFTIQLRDPLGNSFIGSPHFENPEEDPQIQVEQYDRTHDESDMLGLNDIKTEGYELVPEGQGGDTPAAQHSAPQQHRIGSDHPAHFTKGMQEDDTTVSSYDFEHRSEAQQNADGEKR